jgi:hypothetical protein
MKKTDHPVLTYRLVGSVLVRYDTQFGRGAAPRAACCPVAREPDKFNAIPAAVIRAVKL